MRVQGVYLSFITPAHTKTRILVNSESAILDKLLDIIHEANRIAIFLITEIVRKKLMFLFDSYSIRKYLLRIRVKKSGYMIEITLAFYLNRIQNVFRSRLLYGN